MTRTDMLHVIDGQIAVLSQLIAAHHAAGAENKHMALLTEAASHLAALRGQVETARSPYQLASLRLSLAGAVQNAGTAMISVAAGLTAQQQLAARLYDTRMTAAERGMAEISRRDDILFAAADRRAEQLGLDVEFFRDQRRLLEAEAEEARKRGDRLAAIVPEGLLAHNTANMLEDIADQTGQPEDRDKANAARKLAAEADRKVRKAAQAEAARAAGGRHFGSDSERDRWIAGDAGRRVQLYQDRVDAIHPSSPQQDERHSKLATRDAAFADGLDTAPVGQFEQAESSLAASLPASVRDAATSAARPIAQDTSRAEVDGDHEAIPVTPVKMSAAMSSPGSSVTL